MQDRSASLINPDPSCGANMVCGLFMRFMVILTRATQVLPPSGSKDQHPCCGHVSCHSNSKPPSVFFVSLNNGENISLLTL